MKQKKGESLFKRSSRYRDRRGSGLECLEERLEAGSLCSTVKVEQCTRDGERKMRWAVHDLLTRAYPLQLFFRRDAKAHAVAPFLIGEWAMSLAWASRGGDTQARALRGAR